MLIVVSKGLGGDGILADEGKEQAKWISGGRVFQAEGMAWEKAKRLQRAW